MIAIVLAHVSAASGLLLAGIVLLGAAAGLIAPEQLLAGTPPDDVAAFTVAR